MAKIAEKIEVSEHPLDRKIKIVGLILQLQSQYSLSQEEAEREFIKRLKRAELLLAGL